MTKRKVSLKFEVEIQQNLISEQSLKNVFSMRVCEACTVI